jgi:hypothetical protein
LQSASIRLAFSLTSFGYAGWFINSGNVTIAINYDLIDNSDLKN